MFRKSFIFILLITFAGVAAYGQPGKTSTTTPAPKGEGQSLIAYSFGNGSYIGVQIDEVNKENMAKYGLREVRGVAIEKVLDDSPAKAAGLQNGDVIIKFNGEEVTSERKLVRLLSEVAPDHQANLRIVRGGDERDVTVTVGKRPGLKFDNGVWATTFPGHGKFDMPKMPKMPKMNWKTGDLSVGGFAWAGSGRYIGASLMSLSKQLGDYFGVADGKGMLITSVKEDSPAAKAGLKAGDVIVEVDGKEISADHSLFTVLHDKKDGAVTLTVVRDRNRQTFTVTPEERNVGELFEDFEPGAYKAIAPIAVTKALEELRYITPPVPPAAAYAPMPPLPMERVLMPIRVL
jgi:serine protease Do